MSVCGGHEVFQKIVLNHNMRTESHTYTMQSSRFRPFLVISIKKIPDPKANPGCELSEKYATILFPHCFKKNNSQSLHFQVLLTSSPSVNSSRQQSVRKHMTEGPVGPSLILLTVPMIFGLVSIMLFSLVDTFYISLIGARELVAISFTFLLLLL